MKVYPDSDAATRPTISDLEEAFAESVRFCECAQPRYVVGDACYKVWTTIHCERWCLCIDCYLQTVIWHGPTEDPFVEMCNCDQPDYVVGSASFETPFVVYQELYSLCKNCTAQRLIFRKPLYNEP